MLPPTARRLFVIFWTNIVQGGLTAPLVSALGIPNQVDGTLDMVRAPHNMDCNPTRWH